MVGSRLQERTDTEDRFETMRWDIGSSLWHLPHARDMDFLRDQKSANAPDTKAPPSAPSSSTAAVVRWENV
jgi:hypothetical protein